MYSEPMYRQEQRAFSYAVLASIVLHGALLFGVSQRSRPQLAEAEFPPLIARLVELAAPAPVAVPPQLPRAEPEKPRPRPRAASAPKPVAKAPPAPVAVAEPMPRPPAEEAASEERIEPAVPAPAPAAPAPEIARTAPAPAPQLPRVAEPAPAAQPLAQYRLQLIGAARKYKRYPRLAMENNWEGGVVVRMAFGGNGLLAGLTIRTSSGYAVLDQQALEMFKQAAKTVEVPAALRGREFTFEVRAIYNLTDQDSG